MHLHCIHEKMVKGTEKVHSTFTVLLQNDGPNCAAGLVLVLSVDTLVLQLATVSTVGYEQCIGHGWKGHRGRRGKCDLQSRLTPAGPTYHVPTMLRRALLIIRPTWLL